MLFFKMNRVLIAINTARCLFLASTLFVTSCSDFQIQTEAEAVNEQIIVKRTKLDFKPEPYGANTNLSNGYSLSYRVFYDNRFDQPIESLTLMKGRKEIRQITARSYGSPRHYLGYIKTDFRDTFVFLEASGGGSSANIRLIDKATGTNIVEGVLVTINEEEELLLYLENSEELRLYDNRNKKVAVIDVNKPVINLFNVWNWDCAVSISNCPWSDEVILDYEFEDERYRKRYSK